MARLVEIVHPLSVGEVGGDRLVRSFQLVQLMQSTKTDLANVSARVVVCWHEQAPLERDANIEKTDGNAAGSSVLRSMSVSQPLAVPPAVISPLMCVYPSVRNSLATRSARKQSSPFLVMFLTDAGAFVGFLVNANSTLNQWPLGHDGVSHVCNGEADVDSRRVFMAAHLQEEAIDPKAMRRLSVHCAQVMQQGISLIALNWSFRSRSSRAMTSPSTSRLVQRSGWQSAKNVLPGHSTHCANLAVDETQLQVVMLRTR